VAGVPYFRPLNALLDGAAFSTIHKSRRKLIVVGGERRSGAERPTAKV
jgi:hypothetical protein